MKNIFKLFTLSLVSIFTFSSINFNQNESLINKYKYNENTFDITNDDIYDYINENENDKVLKLAITNYIERNDLLRNIYDFETSYNAKLKRNMLDLMKQYEISSIFSEELMVSDLKARMYNIDTQTSGIDTISLGLKYDYSDYIKRELNYDIYMEMIKELYILEKFPNLIDSNSRFYTVYQVDDVSSIEKVVNGLYNGDYSNLEDVINSRKEIEKDSLGYKYCYTLGKENPYYKENCTASTSSSSYDEAINRFTKCENDIRCTLEEGFEYQLNLVDSNEYSKKYFLNDLLESEDYLNHNFNTNLSDYYIEVISYVNMPTSYNIVLPELDIQITNDNIVVREYDIVIPEYFPEYSYPEVILPIKDSIYDELKSINYNTTKSIKLGEDNFLVNPMYNYDEFTSYKDIVFRNNDRYYIVKCDYITYNNLSPIQLEEVLHNLIGLIRDSVIYKTYFSDSGLFTDSEIDFSSVQGKLTYLSYDELLKKVNNKDSFSIVIGSNACSYCKKLTTALERYIDDKIVYYMDISEIYSNPQFMTLLKDIPDDRNIYKIESTPTILVVKDGLFKDGLIGAYGLDGGIDYYKLTMFLEGKYVDRPIADFHDENKL